MNSKTMTLSYNQEIRMNTTYPVGRITIGTAMGYLGHNDRNENPWTNQSAGCLEADYPGKAEALAAKHAATAASPMVEDGQVVRIEGLYWKVKYEGPRYSNPISFKPIVAGDEPQD